jgi:two-component system cell cycle sensor histidine kinase/response regulator CckA
VTRHDPGEQRDRLLFEQHPMPMWVYDTATLRFIAVNDAAVRHYGYTREEFLAMAITDIRPREDVEALLTHLGEGGTGSPIPRTWRHRTKDGRLIDVEITAGRAVFEGRDAALILANDVSDRRRMQQRLMESEKLEAVGRLAGGVAHDFNNLLTVIHGHASMLADRLDRAEQADVGEILRAAEQAAALTRQLLAFGRRQVLHPDRLNLNEVVAGMQSMLGRIIGNEIGVAVRFANGLEPVEADRVQLERAILDLAANAREAMPRGGRLTVETANVELDDLYVSSHGDGKPGPHVMLAVSDTGVGMSKAVQRHLFEPFFTTKPVGAGSGLGLATVFGIVKQSGGHIHVESEEGAGTTFKVYLPAVPAGAAVADPPGAERATADGGETILLVDDDPSMRNLVRAMLEAAGYRVVAASGADEAEQAIADQRRTIDLVLTDVTMPGVDGRALARRLAALRPGARVLFMSGYSDEAVRRHGVMRPDAGFVEKPFDAETLTSKVRELLERPA